MSLRPLLKRLGWTARAAGRAFEVRRASGGLVGRLVLIGEPGAARGLAPAFRVSAEPAGPLPADEARALEEAAAALYVVVESRRGANRRRGAPRAESHEGRDGVDRLLRATHVCNQRCGFCFVPLEKRPGSLDEARAELDVLAAELGPDGTLTLSGGEPTADPRLSELLAYARRRGIKSFRLQTNAVLLTEKLRLRLTALGVTGYFVSFHSHIPALYDRITGTRGQYRKAVDALERLLGDVRCRVACNVVVNSLNFETLPDLAAFLAGLARRARGPARRLELYFSLMNGLGQEKAPELAVSIDRVKPSLRRALEVCAQEGLWVAAFAGECAFPPCAAQRPSEVASERPLPRDRARYAEAVGAGESDIGRVKRSSCRSCPYDDRCLGVPAAYARRFGLAALG